MSTPNQEPQFSLEAVQDAIGFLAVNDQQLVLDALLGRVSEAPEAVLTLEIAETESISPSIIAFAEAFAETNDEATRNTNSWHKNLKDLSSELLSDFADSPESLDEVGEITELALQTAALTFVYICLNNATGNDNYDAVLKEAEIPASDVLDEFKAGEIQAYVVKGKSREEMTASVNKSRPTLESYRGRLHPAFWEEIVPPFAQRLRTKLIDSGIVLAK